MSTSLKSCLNGSTMAFGVGTILFAVGYGLLTFWGKPTLQNAKESTTWPTVPGVVTESEVVSHRSDDGTTYSAEVTYRYTVNEKEIHSNTVWFGDNYSSSNRSQFVEIVNRYPVGKEVTVFYKPNDEFIAVLEPGAVFSSYTGCIVAWVFMGLGSVIMLVPMLSVHFRRKSLFLQTD